jgi:hypothetical protein
MVIRGIKRLTPALLLLPSESHLTFSWVTTPSRRSWRRDVTTDSVSRQYRITPDSGEEKNNVLDFEKRRFLKSWVFLFAGVSMTGACHAEEIDPFAAMDAAISAGLTSRDPSMKKLTGVTDTKYPMTTTPKDSKLMNLSNSSLSSDLERALNESQRRKTIDPRTHG